MSEMCTVQPYFWWMIVSLLCYLCPMCMWLLPNKDNGLVVNCTGESIYIGRNGRQMWYCVKMINNNMKGGTINLQIMPIKSIAALRVF